MNDTELLKHNCRQAVFRVAMLFLCGEKYNESRVRSIFQMHKEAVYYGLSFYINFPRVFFLSPKYACFFSSYRPLDEIYRISYARRPNTIIHALTACHLYEINQFWTHFVCEKNSCTSREYYDPYLNDLFLDFPEKMGYNPPRALELKKMPGVKILITKEG